MANQDAVKKERLGISLKIRAVLLGLQILLPFALYFFMQNGWLAGVYTSAGFIVASMVLLIWLK